MGSKTLDALMVLTDVQHRWLQWLRDHGGVARMNGQHLVAQGARTNLAASVSFMHLIAKGAVEAKGGEFVITEYGLRCLTP